MKKFIAYSFIIIVTILCFSHTFCVVLSNVNYNYNVKAWNELNYNGIIYNQYDCENMKYGLGTVAKNGCGAVAVYNILLLENKPKSLPEIIKFFDNSNENLYGILGTNPFSLMNYLKNENYKVNAFLNKNDFKKNATNSKYSLLFYFNLKGGHYQLFYNYNENNNTFQFINSTYIKTLENFLENKNDCFMMLITIN